MKNSELRFPCPLVINRRRYWLLSNLDDFDTVNHQASPGPGTRVGQLVS